MTTAPFRTEALAPPPDLFVTGELGGRPPRSAGQRSAQDALRDLGRHIAEDPASALPRFVALAMELTASSSAGLSLYETGPQDGVFRWTHLQGSLARFEDATTPRHYSPCGVTLDRDAPVLSRHPERYYDWISDAGIAIPEVLLVPLHIGSEEPLGTLWVVGDVEGHFRPDDARLISELAEFIRFALLMQRNQGRLQDDLDQQGLLAREMDHRIKNLFAMAQGMIRATARTADSAEVLAESLAGRLDALAKANALASRVDMASGQSLAAVPLDRLVATVLAAHEGEGEASRFDLAGTEIGLGQRAGNWLALVLHELATNAAKYGALSEPGGRIAVAWREDGDTALLRWQERGGPTVDGPPDRAGFGTTLVRRTVESQLAGSVRFDWRPGGLVATLEFARERLAL
jgi:two-component sensor histidine kinase